MKTSISIIGSGPSALLLAAFLDETKFDVTIYEKNAAPSRKFLVAGDGGFNLTHGEELQQFISRYTPSDFFKNIIPSFTNNDLREWLKTIGIETFVGSSNRIFPVKGIKPIDVLNAILDELKIKNVTIKTNHEWKGWNSEKLSFEGCPPLEGVGGGLSAIVVFALGGASWKVTGSSGAWTNYFSEKGIEIVPFQPSNCAFEVKWKEEFVRVVEGQSIKNISITCGGKEKKGEVVITKFGLEGGVLYALSPEIRKQSPQYCGDCGNKSFASIFIDLKPVLSLDEIKTRFGRRGNRSIKKMLVDHLNFTDTHVELLKTVLSKEEFIDPEVLAEKIKKLPLVITSAAPIDEAISTVGGIALSEMDENFQLKKLPNNYCIGEMLDWDAPTGGYLLQACFSMGVKLAKHLNAKS